MFSNTVIAAAAAVGVGIWVYRYFGKRATAGQFDKTIAPALVAGVLTFLVMLTILATIM